MEFLQLQELLIEVNFLLLGINMLFIFLLIIINFFKEFRNLISNLNTFLISELHLCRYMYKKKLGLYSI